MQKSFFFWSIQVSYEGDTRNFDDYPETDWRQVVRLIFFKPFGLMLMRITLNSIEHMIHIWWKKRKQIELSGAKRYRERVPDVWRLLVQSRPRLLPLQYRIQNLNTDAGSGENWTLNSFLNYSWISPPVIYKFLNLSLVCGHIFFTVTFFWLLTVCAGLFLKRDAS